MSAMSTSYNNANDSISLSDATFIFSNLPNVDDSEL